MEEDFEKQNGIPAEEGANAPDKTGETQTAQDTANAQEAAGEPTPNENGKQEEKNDKKAGYNANPYGDPRIPPSNYFTPAVEEVAPSNGTGIASLVLGILSLLFSCCCGFGLLTAIPGVILAIVDSVKRKKMGGYAIAGLILSILGFVFGFLTLISVTIAFSDPELIEMWREILNGNVSVAY